MDASNGGSADARQSHAVPADAWEQPEMRAALASREISAVYRLLRKHGVSQRQIAAMTGQSQSEVSEILKGRQVMAYDVLTRIADGLGDPRERAGHRAVAGRPGRAGHVQRPRVVAPGRGAGHRRRCGEGDREGQQGDSGCAAQRQGRRPPSRASGRGD